MMNAGAAAATNGYLSHYTQGQYAPFVEGYRTAGTDPVSILDICHPPGHYPDPPVPELVLISVHECDGPTRLDFGAGRYVGPAPAGSLVLAPPDTATDVLIESRHRIRATVLPLGKVAALIGTSGASLADFGPLHEKPFRSTFLSNLCDRLWREAANDNPHGDLFADGALVTIAASLLGLAHRSLAPPPSGLSSERLRRVQDYVHAHLADNLTLTDLAAVACLSPYHFARAFKASTGASPLAFVLARRVERARDLLARSDLPLAQVAYACGFASQAHFSTVFRKHTGATPGQYRRDC